MSNNLTNSMISILTSVKQCEDQNKNTKNIESIYQVDIKTIVTNAKNDKRFHKLLSLCIKYDIHLFNQYNDVQTLLSIENLLLQATKKQRDLTKELSEKINEISKNGPNNTWLLDIDNTYAQYRKLFKEIEIIDYVLKNIYNDKQLEELCCIKNINQQSSSNTSPNYNITTSTNITTPKPIPIPISIPTLTNDFNIINDTNITNTINISNTSKIKNLEKNKKEKLSKYIAVYSN
jgi:hypothetical protein